MNQSAVQLRTAEPAAAPAIHHLHTRSVQTLCRSHYTPAQIAGWLGRRQPAGYLPAIEREEMFVAAIAGKLVGFGHAVVCEIAAIFVDPDWAGRGGGDNCSPMLSPWRKEAKAVRFCWKQRSMPAPFTNVVAFRWSNKKLSNGVKPNSLWLS